MFGIFKKKSDDTIEKIENTNDVKENIQNEPIKDIEEVSAVKVKPKEDFITIQSIAMGMDMKQEVEQFSKAFFQSRNEEKAKAYSYLYDFMLTLEPYEKDMIKDITYLEFKEKEEQIYNKIKLGYSQYLSKGSHLTEEMKRNIDLVFSDIKKLPSRGHRYWYYKIYIWQEAKKVD